MPRASPRWIAGHVLVAAAVVVMVNLGLWQLRRLDERRDANDVVRQRALAPVVELNENTESARDDPVALEFRRVQVAGTFDASHEVLVGYRTSRGLPGYHVITPLRVSNDTAVLVNRGFVPLDLADRWPVPDAAPPPGEVTVVGIARRSVRSATGRIAPDAPAPPKLNAVDIPAVDRYVPEDLLPLQIELQRPLPRGFPDPLPELDLSEGPHLSYALQWFAFSAGLLGGWATLVRRRGHARRTPVS